MNVPRRYAINVAKVGSTGARSSDGLPGMSESTGRLGNPEYAASGERRKTSGQQTVFYVDDNRRALRVLTSVLKGCGYRVLNASDAGEALERMERTGFDLVLLTYRLPRMISFKLAREIKRVSPGTPVVLVSGHTLFAPGTDACRCIYGQRRKFGQLAGHNAGPYR